jgi:hypothetical protein
MSLLFFAFRFFASHSTLYRLVAASILSASAAVPGTAQTAAQPPAGKLVHYNVDPISC